MLDKNLRPFAGNKGGLLDIKLSQLSRAAEIERIVVSSNDPRVLEYASGFAARSAKAIEVLERPDHLGTSSTSTDEVIRYVPSIIRAGTVLWTHVTSPFVDEGIYDAAIQQYRKHLAAGTHDSLMAVTPLRSFIWNEDGPLNYDREVEKWPRTQTLKVLYEVNSAMFIIDAASMLVRGDRIGKRPLLFEMEHGTAMDIDWENQFLLAEQVMLARAGVVTQHLRL